jgi:hypothetical protein
MLNCTAYRRITEIDWLRAVANGGILWTHLWTPNGSHTHKSKIHRTYETSFGRAIHSAQDGTDSENRDVDDEDEL